MRLTERDRRIMEAIHDFDGMLGFSQIRRKFFSGKSQAEVRLRLLYHNRYLNRPDKEKRPRGGTNHNRCRRSVPWLPGPLLGVRAFAWGSPRLCTSFQGNSIAIPFPTR